MTIFNLYIFNKNGSCVFYNEWKREKKPTMSRDEEFKLVYGMLHSLRSFCSKLSPSDSRTAFQSFQTNKYRLHYFETLTGLKFVLNTDKKAVGIPELLRQIYSSVFVEYVVKNPLLKPHAEIDSDLFKAKLNELVQKHPAFVST